MKKLPSPISLLLGIILSLLILIPPAWAFCGFYVAQADTSLYNNASQVIIARDGDRTVLTMANDYQGDVQDFAMVVPVPVILQEEQINVGDPSIIERLDSFSAPRLVEYFDPDPCAPVALYGDTTAETTAPNASSAPQSRSSQSLGVTIEASYTVGEYDILILSAQESNGLETWLMQNNYQIPTGASEILQPYIRQGMKFFVAKINLEELDRSGSQQLRPLQMAFESNRFMLPIRLGMVNAQGVQDLVVYILTPNGQVEVTNYRTVKIPSDAEIPVFVKNEFSDFYRSMFQTAYERQGRNVAFLEYAWDISWCDPCSAPPLTPEELRQAGVFWSQTQTTNRGLAPPTPSTFITRLHVRYDRSHFPEDLMFQETANRENFQGRYILRHPFTGAADCPAGRRYRQSLPQRFEREAQTLVRLTGWDLEEIRPQLPEVSVEDAPWWQQLWPEPSESEESDASNATDVANSRPWWRQLWPWGG